MSKINVTWNDLHNATPEDIKSTYKLSDRQFEQELRSHLDGANHNEMNNLYKTVYDKRRK